MPRPASWCCSNGCILTQARRASPQALPEGWMGDGVTGEGGRNELWGWEGGVLPRRQPYLSSSQFLSDPMTWSCLVIEIEEWVRWGSSVSIWGPSYKSLWNSCMWILLHWEKRLFNLLMNKTAVLGVRKANLTNFIICIKALNIEVPLFPQTVMYSYASLSPHRSGKRTDNRMKCIVLLRRKALCKVKCVFRCPLKGKGHTVALEPSV